MASSAFIANLRITNSLQLDPGVVITGSIASDAITATANVPVTTTPTAPGTKTVIGSTTINSLSSKPIRAFTTFSYREMFQASAGVPSTVTLAAWLNIGTQSVLIARTTVNLAAGASAYVECNGTAVNVYQPTALGNQTVSVSFHRESGNPDVGGKTGEFFINAECNKR